MNQGIEAGKRNGGCLRCGAKEFRIDGYCTVECRDMHEVERERDELQAALTRVREWAAATKQIEVGTDPQGTFGWGHQAGYKAAGEAVALLLPLPQHPEDTE